MKLKKMLAPIIITLLLVAYLIFYGLLLTVIVPDMPLIGKIAGGVIALGLTATAVCMLVERIKEIRSGEEDDLSKY